MGLASLCDRNEPPYTIQFVHGRLIPADISDRAFRVLRFAARFM